MGEYNPPSVNVGTVDRPTIIRRPNGWKPDRDYPMGCFANNFDAAHGDESIDSAGLDVRGRLDFAQCGSFDDGWFSLVPNGWLDADGHKTWNAGPSCCDTHSAGIDDVGYWRTVLGNVRALGWRVNWNLVFGVGYSAGAFMMQLLACMHPELIRGFISFSGAFPTSDGLPTLCSTASGVSALIVHGTLDTTVPYLGGIGNPPVSQRIPITPVVSVAQTTASWATRNGLVGPPVAYGSPVNISTVGTPGGLGAETNRSKYPNDPGGAPKCGDVEQWDMNLVPHSIGSVSPGGGQILAAWLMARPFIP